MQQYHTAVDINPGYASVHMRLATLLQHSGDTATALQHYTAALSADPGDSAIHNNVAGLFYQHGR